MTFLWLIGWLTSVFHAKLLWNPVVAYASNMTTNLYSELFLISNTSSSLKCFLQLINVFFCGPIIYYSNSFNSNNKETRLIFNTYILLHVFKKMCMCFVYVFCGCVCTSVQNVFLFFFYPLLCRVRIVCQQNEFRDIFI